MAPRTHGTSEPTQKGLLLSIVIPVFNEEENLKTCHEEVSKTLKSLNESYEIIFVDDGSTDSSLKVLRGIAGEDKKVTVISFRKNYGQSAAMSAGIAASRGEFIITLDADLQNDPRDIPAMLAKLHATGADIVSGWRKNRKDKFFSRVFLSRLANGLISSITGVRLHDYGCTLKIYRAEVLKDVMLYGELHRFLPALCSWHGAKIVEVIVNHRPRTSGKSKYGLKRVYKVLFDLLSVKYFLAYNAKPLHFFATAGLLIMTPGLLLASWISIRRFLFGVDISPRIPTLIFCALAILTGIHLIMIGLLADLIVRTSKEGRTGKPQEYKIREIIQGSS